MTGSEGNRIFKMIQLLSLEGRIFFSSLHSKQYPYSEAIAIEGNDLYVITKRWNEDRDNLMWKGKVNEDAINLNLLCEVPRKVILVIWKHLFIC